MDPVKEMCGRGFGTLLLEFPYQLPITIQKIRDMSTALDWAERNCLLAIFYNKEYRPY